MCDAMGMTNSVVAGASGGGAVSQAPGQLPPVKGGGAGMADLLPPIESIMSALTALVAKLGGGAAAAVAGASGDAAGGGPAKDATSGATDVAQANGGPVQQGPLQKLPTTVAGESGPGQAPTKVAGDSGPGGKVEQTGVGGAHDVRRGRGHLKGRGKGHAKHMSPIQSPGQTPGKVGGEVGGPVQQAPAKVEATKPVVAPVSQVAGDSGSGKDAPAKPVETPVTQVAGDSGSGTVEPTKPEPTKPEPTKPEPVQTAPVQSPPESQVGGDSGSEPSTPVTQAPTQSEPTQSAPKAPPAGDVEMIEFDSSNVMQLRAADGSHLYFAGSSVSYLPRSGSARQLELPASGFAVTLSDGTKVSYGLHDKNSWGEESGTPRDLEVLTSDGTLFASRTDDGTNDFHVSTPLTSFHLLEIASMLFDGSYAKFGSGSGEVVQQSGNVVQQTA